jgi:hypothetical protein
MWQNISLPPISGSEWRRQVWSLCAQQHASAAVPQSTGDCPDHLAVMISPRARTAAVGACTGATRFVTAQKRIKFGEQHLTD